MSTQAVFKFRSSARQAPQHRASCEGRRRLPKPATVYRLLWCWIGISLLSASGCGPKLPYEVVPFSGTVTYQGQPVQGLPVFFLPETGRPSNGFSDKDGKFTMIYTAKVDGIQTGKGTFYVELSPNDGSHYNNREILKVIAKKYAKGNDLLQFEFKKKEKNFELKLE